MKKIRLMCTLLLIGASAVVFNSCSNENELIEQESFLLNDGITVNNGILTFSTVDLYDETIQLLSASNESELNKWEKAYNYSSLRNSKGNLELLQEVGNTFATLLNPEKEIIIESNYYHLDFEKGTISKSKWDVLNELKSTNTNESNTFNFNDDVDIFDENPTLKSSSYSCPYGGRLWVKRNTLANGHANYRLEYDSWSIFRHVRAEIEPDGSYVKVWLSIKAGDENKWNQRNEDQCGKQAYNISYGGSDGSSNTLSYDIYNSTKQLSAFDFKVTFKARSQTSPYDDIDTWNVYLDCETVVCP